MDCSALLNYDPWHFDMYVSRSGQYIVILKQSDMAFHSILP